jgi:hypothetical protein
MTSYIDACSPSGNGRRITLLGTDLIFGGIDNVFVYPTLDINRLRNALQETLSFWPILTGRLIVDNDDQYIIECSDNSIPFTYTENDQLKCWPDLPVVVDDTTILQPFIDSIQYKPEIEPLLRLKVTHLLLSDEYVLGTSVSHMVGDADSTLHFLNDLSRIYQHLEPVLPPPIFERQLLKNEEPDFSLPLIKELSEKAEKRETIIDQIIKEQLETDPLNMSFSSEQLTQLHSRVENTDQVTINDVLCAYIIQNINKHLFSTTDEYIRRVHIMVNYRGVCNTLASIGHVSNSIITTPSSNFQNPLSLSDIAKTIRQAITTIRDKDFLEKWIISADALTRQLIKDGRLSFVFGSNKFVFNSNLKYDWANQVNFGMINQCRFHTLGLYKFYFRIFQLNPVKNEDGSWTRDNGGAEVAFRIPKGKEKETFLEEWKKDIQQNFQNVK